MHLGSGEDFGMSEISENLDKVFDAVPGKSMILLENMAGQGTNIGYKFEQLKQIINSCSVKSRHRLGVCFDTCHSFASGYDLSSKEGYIKTFKDFDKIIGLENLKVIHINDSFGAMGSRVDRHAPLGKGKIPLDIFKLIMNDKALQAVPKILETPSDDAMKLWACEIKLLRSFVK